MVVKLSKGLGIEARRRTRQFNAENNASYSSANTTEIIIDMSSANELYDFTNGYLLFDFVGSQTGGATLSFNDWAASTWIREIRLEDRSGKSIGRPVNHYNGLARMTYEMKSNNEANSSYLDRLEGAKASATDGTVSRQYAHRFLSHIFTAQDYYPANLHSGLRIIITLEAAANVITFDGSSPVYTLSNVHYVCDAIVLKPAVQAALMKDLNNGGVKIHYTRYHSRRTTEVSGDQIVNVGVLDGPVKDIQAFFVEDTARDGDSEDFWATFTQNSLASYQMKLGDNFLNERRVQMSSTRLAEYTVEYLKSQKMNLQQLMFGSEGLVLANRFVLGQRVDKSHSDEVISSSKDDDHNKLEIDLGFGAGSPNANTLYVYAHLDQMLIILPGSQLKMGKM